MTNEDFMKVLASKYVRSTSLIVQSINIGRQFAIVKAETKTTKTINLPNGYGMKGNLECMFDGYKAQVILSFKLPACKTITNHINLCPEIFGKAMAPKSKEGAYF